MNNNTSETIGISITDMAAKLVDSRDALRKRLEPIVEDFRCGDVGLAALGVAKAAGPLLVRGIQTAVRTADFENAYLGVAGEDVRTQYPLEAHNGRFCNVAQAMVAASAELVSPQA